MGCKASKEGSLEPRTRPTDAGAPSPSSSRKSRRSRADAADSKASPKLMRLLVKAQETPTGDKSTLWPQVIELCQKDPTCVSYQSPKSKSTPLHAACAMVDFDDGSTDDEQSPQSVLSAIRALIQARPDSLSMKNTYGFIPLHYVLAPSVAPPGQKAAPPRWKSRAHAIRLLVSADYETSLEYLSRNNVTYGSNSGGGMVGACTPLYWALQSIPDDFGGTSVDFISALQESNPAMVSVSNGSDADKPLALLYRRFTRQFDLSEKFFAGDNSRPEVVEHRRKYKLAAGNTWKMIELLLRPEHVTDSNSGDWRIVHRAVQVDTPPDLLRYIIETNSEELTHVDDEGNLPLHYAAKSTPTKRASFPEFHSKYVVDELLYKFPEGASTADADGKYPLTLAIDSGKHWIGGGVKSLYDAYPQALEQINLEEHPSLQNALSFDVVEATKDEKNGVVKDEHHDAIMLVQRPNVEIIEIVTSMWAHEEDAGVQMLGCVALSNRATKSDDAEILRISLSAVAAVVNSMKAHPNEAIVQEKACTVLKCLSSSDGKREVSFVASGAIAAIVGAMQAHVGDAAVQEEACGAIAAVVSVGGADRATILASVSGFTAILNALGAHPEVANVQKEGLRALKAVTEFQNANLPELPRSQTEPLLQTAKENFPYECAEDANILLSRLE